jgi:hypothetical protein
MSWGGDSDGTAVAVSLQAAEFGTGIAEIGNLTGKIMLESVLPPRTRQTQRLTGTLQIASLPPGPLDLRFGLGGRDQMAIEKATLGLAGGVLSLTGLTIERDHAVDTVIEVGNIDLGAVLTLIGIDGLSGTGAIDGRIPVHVDTAGAAISGGRLAARRPGVVQYTGNVLPAAVSAAEGQAASTLKLVQQALADFHYTDLVLSLDRSPTGEGSLLVGLKGANPAVLEGHPFAVNVRLDANFDRLAAVFLDGYAAANGLLRQAAGQ